MDDAVARSAMVAALADAPAAEGACVLRMAARVYTGAEKETRNLALVAEVFGLH